MSESESHTTSSPGSLRKFKNLYITKKGKKMSNYNSLKTTINANVQQNGRQEITGQILNSVLNAMVNTLGAGYQFAGVATTATNPGSPDAKVFYIANGKGTYTNFGGISVTEDDVVVLYWDSSWHKVSTGIASQAKLSELESEVDDISRDVERIGGYVEGATEHSVTMEWESGGINSNTGAELVNVERTRTGFVALADVKKVVASEFKHIYVFCYSSASNDGYIAEDFFHGSINTLVLSDRITDTNVKYVRFMINNTIATTSNFSFIGGANIEGLLERVGDIETELARRIVAIVDKNGNGNYTTISDAVLGTNDGDAILVMPGIYDESVHMNRKERYIIGLCKETCILRNGKQLRAEPPIELTMGGIYNMTIYAGTYDTTNTEQSAVAKSYGIHCDSWSSVESVKVVVRNCDIKSEWHAAVGLGVRFGASVEFVDCTFTTNCESTYSTSGTFIPMGAFFFHDDDSVTSGVGGSLSVRNCKFIGKKYALRYAESRNDDVMTSVEFVGNTFYSEEYGIAIEGVDGYKVEYAPNLQRNILLAETSHSNNYTFLNRFGGGGSVSVIDNLTSTSATSALSANQGRVLASQIGNINTILTRIVG